MSVIVIIGASGSVILVLGRFYHPPPAVRLLPRSANQGGT